MGNRGHNPNEGNQHFRVVLYLTIIIPILFSLCAGFNLVIYGMPNKNPVQSEIAQVPNFILLLLVVGGIGAAMSGILSNIIADWIFEAIPPHKKKIIAIAVTLVFVLLTGISILVAILLQGSA